VWPALLPFVEGGRVPKGLGGVLPERVRDTVHKMRSERSVVVEAVRETVRRGSARLWSVSFFDPPRPGWLPTSIASGVADFSARRVGARTHLSDTEGWEELGANLLERWPWLDDDERGDVSAGGESDGVEFVYAAGASYASYRENQWGCHDDGRHDWPRSQTDPTWILDPLTIPGQATRLLGAEPVHDRLATRYAVVLDLESVARGLGATFPLPVGPFSHAREIYAEVWVDESGLLRRASWAQKSGRGARSGGVLERAGRALGRDAPARADRRQWTTTELWDHGCDVDIRLPERVLPPATTRELVNVVRDLSERRREWRRTHSP